MNKAILIQIARSWVAPTIIFKLEPELEGYKFLVIAAANGIERYQMIIYTCDETKDKFINFRLINLDCYPKSIKCFLPSFKETLKFIGYKMIGEIPRQPKPIIRKPR